MIAQKHRPIYEIEADIKKIRASIANANSEQKADDLYEKKKTTDELKEILYFLEDELLEAQGLKRDKWVTGKRRGFNG